MVLDENDGLGSGRRERWLSGLGLGGDGAARRPLRQGGGRRRRDRHGDRRRRPIGKVAEGAPRRLFVALFRGEDVLHGAALHALEPHLVDVHSRQQHRYVSLWTWPTGCFASSDAQRKEGTLAAGCEAAQLVG